MGVGKDFAKRNSSFIKFDEDGVVEGVFNGMKAIIKETFGEEKEIMRYKIDDKSFDSQSVKLAELMDAVPVGSKVKITKTGQSMDTKYEVEVIGAQSKAGEDEGPF
jgi:hypothetical protein